MANLSSALNYALSGLSTAAAQSALASRNVANVQNTDYSRRSAEIITLPGGGTSISAYNRSADKQLLDKLLQSSSMASGQQAMLEALTRIGGIVGDPSASISVPALVSKLQSSLRDFETDPSSSLLANGTVQAAQTLASALNESSHEIQQVRLTADQDMAAAVDRTNTLLAQFKIVNDAIVRGSGTASDLTDNLDERDRILKLMSEDIGIRTVTRANNDIAIYTDSGVTLFETSPRLISFAPTAIFGADTIGHDVLVDGVKLFAPGTEMTSRSGKLQALTVIRDRIAPAAQAQLDEVARGLITSFSESDPGVPKTLPVVAGLFRDGSSGVLPSSAAVSAGLALRITLDPAANSNVFLIRDGGFGGPAYARNTDGSALFQARIAELQASFDIPQNFITESGTQTSASLRAYSISTASWMEQQRGAASDAADAGQARLSRSTQALMRVTGVNIDEEMAAILDLEKSYQASAKIVAAVDAMLSSLMEAI